MEEISRSAAGVHAVRLDCQDDMNLACVVCSSTGVSPGLLAGIESEDLVLCPRAGFFQSQFLGGPMALSRVFSLLMGVN